MSLYKFYVIRHGGIRQPASEVECPDDKNAVELAQTMLLGNEAVEAWLGPRFISRVQALIRQEDHRTEQVNEADNLLARSSSLPADHSASSTSAQEKH